MKFKEASFTFHISRESFKPVRLFRGITYMLLKIIALVCSKATFLFLLSFFFKGRRKRKKKWQKSLNWKFRLPVKIDKEGICLLQHLMKGTKIHDIDFEKTWPSK